MKDHRIKFYLGVVGLIIAAFFIYRTFHNKELAQHQSTSFQPPKDAKKSIKNFGREDTAKISQKQSDMGTATPTPDQFVSPRDEIYLAASNSPIEDKTVKSAVGEIIDQFYFLDANRTRRQIVQLEQLHPKKMAEAMIKEFKSLRSSDSKKRDAIITLSKGLNSPYLSPLWQDVLIRDTPRFENESTRMVPGPHRNYIFSAVRSEQEIAIRELGQIMGKSEDASRTLWDLVSNNSAKNFDLKLRIRAFKMIEERDKSAKLKAASILNKDDELRDWLRREK